MCGKYSCQRTSDGLPGRLGYLVGWATWSAGLPGRLGYLVGWAGTGAAQSDDGSGALGVDQSDGDTFGPGVGVRSDGALSKEGWVGGCG